LTDVQGGRVVRVKGPLEGGQQRSELVAGLGRITRLPGPAGPGAASNQGGRVVQFKGPLVGGQQRGELVAGPGRVARISGPAGQAAASIQGGRVLRAEDLLTDGQQRGELIAGSSRIARISGPAGELVLNGKRVRVLWAENPNPCVKHLLVKVASGRVAAAQPEVGGDLLHAVAVRTEGRLGVRQQRGEIGPASWLFRVFG